MARILVTKKYSRNSLLKKWCDTNDKELICRPFITTKASEQIEIKETDWIFFSSPRGVKHFLENYSIENQKIAALSLGTAEAVKHYGYACDFVGNPDLETTDIGLAFRDMVLGDSVLFPISNRSLHRVQSVFEIDQIHNCVVYHTTPLQLNIPENIAVAIVTSPSNAEGLILSGISDKTFMIAFGKSTEAYLKKHWDLAKIRVTEAYTDAAIIQQLEAHLD